MRWTKSWMGRGEGGGGDVGEGEGVKNGSWIIERGV
jgi:hypothetical protein